MLARLLACVALCKPFLARSWAGLDNWTGQHVNIQNRRFCSPHHTEYKCTKRTITTTLNSQSTLVSSSSSLSSGTQLKNQYLDMLCNPKLRYTTSNPHKETSSRLPALRACTLLELARTLSCNLTSRAVYLHPRSCRGDVVSFVCKAPSFYQPTNSSSPHFSLCLAYDIQHKHRSESQYFCIFVLLCFVLASTSALHQSSVTLPLKSHQNNCPIILSIGRMTQPSLPPKHKSQTLSIFPV